MSNKKKINKYDGTTEDNQQMAVNENAPIYLKGVTVGKDLNTDTNYADWSWANQREATEDLMHQFQNNIRKATDYAAPRVGALLGTAFAPAVIEALPELYGAASTASTLLYPYLSKGFQYMGKMFKPSEYLKGAGLTEVANTVRPYDSLVEAAFAGLGLNDLYNQSKEGTLLSKPIDTMFNTLMATSAVSPMITASKNFASIVGNKSKEVFNIIDNYIAKGNGLNLDYKDIINTDWYKKIVQLIGNDNALKLISFLLSNEGRLFILANKTATSASREYARYNDIKDIISEMPAGSLLGGSAGLSALGTVSRPSIGFHDLDFNYSVPGLNSLYELSYSNLDLKVPALYKFIPRSQFFRRLYPILRTTPLYSPVRRFVFRKNGINSDVFLQDEPLLENVSPYVNDGTSETKFTPYLLILDAKLAWTDRSPHAYRVAKDTKDISTFRPYGWTNPVIDVNTGKTLFSPMLFEGHVTSPEGYPNVSFIETYPGSGSRIPVIMNWEGKYKLLDTPSDELLENYIYGVNEAYPGLYGMLNEGERGWKSLFNPAVYNMVFNHIIPKMQNYRNGNMNLEKLLDYMSKGYTLLSPSAMSRVFGDLAFAVHMGDGRIFEEAGNVFPEIDQTHEIRHEILSLYPRTLEEYNVLKPAYLDLGEAYKEAGRTMNYPAELEWETVNSDFREMLLEMAKDGHIEALGFNKDISSVNEKPVSIEDLEKVVAYAASDDNIVEAMSECNGYGRALVNYYKNHNNGKVPTSVIRSWRKAVSKIGITVGATTATLAVVDNSNQKALGGNIYDGTNPNSLLMVNHAGVSAPLLEAASESLKFVSPFYELAVYGLDPAPIYIADKIKENIFQNDSAPVNTRVPLTTIDNEDSLKEKAELLTVDSYRSNNGLYEKTPDWVLPDSIPYDSTKIVRILSNPNSKAHTGYIDTNVWDTLAYHLGRNPLMPLAEGFGLAELESGTGRTYTGRKMNVDPVRLLSGWDYLELSPFLQAMNQVYELIHSRDYINAENKSMRERRNILDAIGDETQKLKLYELDTLKLYINLNQYYDTISNEQTKDSIRQSMNDRRAIEDSLLNRIDSLKKAYSDNVDNFYINTFRKLADLYRNIETKIPLILALDKKFKWDTDFYRHMFNHYLSGKYNPGDEDYLNKVKHQGEELLKSKEWQDWWERSGKYLYLKGKESTLHANGGDLNNTTPSLSTLELLKIKRLKYNNDLPLVRYDNGGLLKYNELSVAERAKLIRFGVQHGMKSVSEIEDMYNNLYNVN